MRIGLAAVTVAALGTASAASASGTSTAAITKVATSDAKAHLRVAPIPSGARRVSKPPTGTFGQSPQGTTSTGPLSGFVLEHRYWVAAGDFQAIAKRIAARRPRGTTVHVESSTGFTAAGATIVQVTVLFTWKPTRTLTTRTLVVETKPSGQSETAIQAVSTDFWSAPAPKRKHRG